MNISDGNATASVAAAERVRARGRRLCLILLISQVLLAGALIAHVPVPASVLDPKSAAEAWNVLRLSTANVERLITENRLPEITDQLSLCTPSLRALAAQTAESPKDARSITELTIQAAVAVSSLAQAGVSGDRALAQSSLASLETDLQRLANYYDPNLVKADIFFCPMHPDFVSPDPTVRCAKCGMALLPRRIPYSFVYTPPGEPTLLLTASTNYLPVLGQPSAVTIRLTHRNGSPVVLSQLLVMHTQPIHLLIIDQGLVDYHHEHPSPTTVPGEYTFSFTPSRAGSYRIFADVVPIETNVQEYPFTDLPTATPAIAEPVLRTSGNTANAGGLTFHLTLDETDGAPPRAGFVRAMHLTIEQPGCGPSRNLEPVMNAFAHMVGFYADHHTVVHFHPEGGEVTDGAQRGGPTLDFKLYPPRPGWLRLFCQVQVEGRMIFAPFDLEIAP